MSANPIYITQALSTVTCYHAECGVVFGLPETLETQLRRSHNSFYCPHGHSQSFRGESDVEKAQRLQKAAEWQASQARTEREQALADNWKLIKKTSRMKKRMKRGHCPVKHCKARFHDLKDHLKTHRRFA